MKKTFTISEISKIVDIPVNTLKHYDRIDLFKPAIVKPGSLYRYYTLEQIYTLVLIKDLRTMDMSIQDIRDYLKERNVSKSLNILDKKLYEIKRDLEILNRKKCYLEGKLNTLKVSHNMRYELNEIVEKTLQERSAMTFGVYIKNDEDKYFASRQLEKSITASLPGMPGMICCTHGVFIPRDELVSDSLPHSAIAFVFVHTSETVPFYTAHSRTIPSCHFICGYFEGKMWDRKPCLERLLDYIQKQQMKIVADAIQINHIDDNLTDSSTEFLYEIQIPVSY